MARRAAQSWTAVYGLFTKAMDFISSKRPWRHCAGLQVRALRHRLAVLRLRSIGPIQTLQLCSSTVNRFSKNMFLSRNKHRMATRVIKLREAEEPAPKMVQEV